MNVLLVSRAPLDRLQAYKERMGWDNLDWVSTVGDDFNRDLGFLNTEEELKPFLESGEIPVTVEKMAELSGTDVKGYVTEGARPERVRARRRDGLPDLRDYCAGARGARDGLLRPARPNPEVVASEGGDEPIWIRRHDEYEAA